MASSRRIDELIQQASDITSAGDRDAFLKLVCADDAELRKQIDARMSGDDDGDSGMGTMIGPYQIVRMLGEGGMGSVFLAQQNQPVKRQVALKVILPGMTSQDVLRRFEAERQALALMDHPNIARVYDAGMTKTGTPYFAMELVDGLPITQFCDQNQLGVPARVELFARVCLAIQHAHRNGIIHRDIKPSNILVASIDGAPTPKVIDFGIAKAIGETRISDRTVQTMAGAMIGTLEYMSPEQAELGGGNIDTRSDIYSLGVLLFELLTGSTPIGMVRGNETPLTDLLRIIREDDARRPSTCIHAGKESDTIAERRSSDIGRLRRELRGDLDWIVLRALEKDRNRRYESAADLADDLQRFLDGRPISARPPSSLYVFRKWVRRNTILFGSACAIVAAVIVGLAGMVWQWQLAIDARNRAELSEHRANAAKSEVLKNAEARRRGAYASTLASALAARERQDFGTARRLLEALDPDLRGFEWRLLQKMCKGDESLSVPVSSNPRATPECLAWIPGKKEAAIITSDGILHTFDDSGQMTGPPRQLPPIDPARNSAQQVHHGLTYSRDGRWIAYAFGSVARVVDASTLKIAWEIPPLTPGTMPQFDWLDRNRLLAGGSAALVDQPDTAAWIVELPKGEMTPLPKGLCAPLAVSGQGDTVVVSTQDHEMFIGSADSVELHGFPGANSITAPENHNPTVLTLSNNGQFLAICYGTRYRTALFMNVFDVYKQKLVFEQDFRASITQVQFHPSKPILAVGTLDSTVRIFNFTVPVPKNEDNYDDGGLRSLRQQLGGADPKAPPRDLITRRAQGGRVHFLLGHEESVAGLRFSENGSRVFTVSSDGTLRCWISGTPPTATRIDGLHTDNYGYAPAASCNGHVVVTNQEGEGVYVHDGRWKSNTIVGVAKAHSALAAFNDGRFITHDWATGELVMWKVQGAAVEPLELWRTAGPAVADRILHARGGVLTRDEKTLVGSLPDKLFVMDVEARTCKIAGNLKQQLGGDGVASHAVSPDGKFIAITGYGSRAQIRPVSEPDQIKVSLPGQRDYDTSLAFHPQHNRLYVGNQDGSVRVFDTTTWTERPELAWHAHSGAVTALAVSSDGKLIATSGGDTLKLWRTDPAAGDPSHELLALRMTVPCNWIQFARDDNGFDRGLLYCSPQRTLDIWKTDE